MTAPDITPDPLEVVQAEHPGFDIKPIPVVPQGPVETRELPGLGRGYRTEQGVTATVGVRLLPMEPRRKVARILPSADVWISGSQAGAQAGGSSAFRLPANTMFAIDHMDEVWACAVATSADISIATTFWSR